MVRRDVYTPTTTCNKQKVEKLSQPQHKSIFASARTKLCSFLSRLSNSTGCAAIRILTGASTTTTNNSELSSVIAFPSQQNSHQITIQMDSHSAMTLSTAAPALSSVQVNASMQTGTLFPNTDTSESCCSNENALVRNDVQWKKSPVKKLSYECSALPDPNYGGGHPHHLQKQKPANCSASCTRFRQTNYPAAVYLTDGENSYFRMVW